MAAALPPNQLQGAAAPQPAPSANPASTKRFLSDTAGFILQAPLLYCVRLGIFPLRRPAQAQCCECADGMAGNHAKPFTGSLSTCQSMLVTAPGHSKAAAGGAPPQYVSGPPVKASKLSCWLMHSRNSAPSSSPCSRCMYSTDACTGRQWSSLLGDAQGPPPPWPPLCWATSRCSSAGRLPAPSTS